MKSKIAILILCVMLLFFVGCTEPQLVQGDEAAGTVQAVGDVVQGIIANPVVQSIPYMPLVTTILSGILALTTAYQTWRKNQAKTATVEIVKGIQKAKEAVPEAKDVINTALEKAESQSTKEIVAEIKAKL